MIVLEYQAAVQKIWDKATVEFNVEKSRERHNVIYRHAFSVACLDNTTLSMKVIGRIIGRDHATVIHARKNHSWNIIQEKAYAQAYCFFSEMLSKKTGEHEDIIQEFLRSNTPISTDKSMIQRYTDIYEAKLKRLEGKYEQEIQTLRHENKVLSKTLKIAEERTKDLNTECLRLKNLL